jgi:quinol monooxygenase YgiN
MGRSVIVAYRPKAGRQADLEALVREHVPILQSRGLVTSRPAMLMKAQDGTIVEIFEWESQAAIDRAHADPTVQDLWRRFGDCCDYLPIGSVPEAGQPFSEFETM